MCNTIPVWPQIPPIQSLKGVWSAPLAFHSTLNNEQTLLCSPDSIDNFPFLSFPFRRRHRPFISNHQNLFPTLSIFANKACTTLSPKTSILPLCCKQKLFQNLQRSERSSVLLLLLLPSSSSTVNQRKVTISITWNWAVSGGTMAEFVCFGLIGAMNAYRHLSSSSVIEQLQALGGGKSLLQQGWRSSAPYVLPMDPGS